MVDLVNPTAVILAGGLGTRLRSIIENQPKVLAEVSGHPFLKYILDQLIAWQIKDVVLCTGHLGEQIEARFGTDYQGLRLRYSRESIPLGTAGALRLALPSIQSDTALVLNGDSYCAADFAEFWRQHCARQATATMLLVNNPDTRRFGSVQIATDGRILQFEEKKEGSKSGRINAGVYLLARDLLQSIPTTRPVSLEREIFPTWIGEDFYGHLAAGPFLDIGTPESYALAEKFFAGLTAHHP
ncbi:MAG TPA: nucleotidyltransferase family protein [Candidatus Competibacter sp.]|nr:nucleotidyltransferase family protein [Candidatus Competibacter sp.]